jgi:predicted AlkP superfamily phosphohydrolase/phosphomutase
MKKVIVIGLDGFEPKLAEALIRVGKLPNLAKLQTQGGYSPLLTTYPAQTPVAWSSFATGKNPGGHGIFDFLRRDPKSYLPMLALNRYEQKNVFAPPQVVNLRRSAAVWDHLTAAGIHSTILRCPCTYPPDAVQGRMLAGVGVPDLRGGLGTSTFYTTEVGTRVRESERVIALQRSDGNIIQTHLIGPRNPKDKSDFQFDITLRVDPQGNRVVISSKGQPNTLELRQGKWSDWLRVKFKMGLLQSVWGQVRFYLGEVTPELRLYASPINFDAQSPLFPISSPPDYAGELASALGLYHTTGMAEDHDGLNNERFDELAFLDQCETVLHERTKMMQHELGRFREGLFYCLFDTPDRLQHMFWRFQEEDHPANRGAHPGEVNPKFKQVIAEHYQACDGIVGQAMRYADPQTLMIVLSDHGMNSFRRGLHLNTWLHQKGFLALKRGVQPGEEAGDFFRAVDWSHTQAYAFGLGGIYLNLRGREGEGIVEPGEAESIKGAIATGLTGLQDPACGKVAVRSVMTRESLYRGPYVSEAPDLLVNFAPGYRVSWGTPLGGVPAGLFEDNRRKWGGDHVIDPSQVPGVLYMNHPIHASSPSLVDLAPTILTALGLPPRADLEGRSLL